MSGKRNYNHLVFFIAAILLISTSVGAVTENFNAFGSKSTTNVCSCDLTQEKFTIQNSGDVTSTYIIEQEGEGAAWTDIAPNTFFLEPGDTKDVEGFVNVPCGAKGEYQLNTTIRTVFDLEKTIEQTLNVQNCPNVQIIPKFSGVQEECPCTPVQYDFEIINTGKHIETYDLSVEPHSDAITMSTPFTVLEPGQKETVSVFINLNCGEYGEKTFTFNALARGTKILGQMDFNLNINKCYDYDLEIGKEYSVCQGVPNVVPFSIKNNAEISNEYNVFVDGPDWINTKNTTISAVADERKDAELLLVPPLEDEGVYQMTLQTTSSRGEEVREKDVSLNSEKCYDYDLFGEDLVGIKCKERTAQLDIKNTGTRRATYWLDLEGPEWVQLQDTKVSLDAGEESVILFDINAPCETEFDEYKNTLFVTIEEVNETYSQEHNIVLVPREDAFLPDMDTTTLTVGYDGGAGDVPITNKGLLQARYDISVVGPEWVNVAPNFIELGPGETGYITLGAYPTNETVADGYKVDLVATVQDEDIEYSTSLILEVEKEKTLSDNIKENMIWVIVGGSLILLLIIILVVFLIVRSAGKKEPKKTTAVAGAKEVKEEKKPEKKAITIEKKEYSKPKTKKKERKWPLVLGIILILLVLGGAAYVAFQKGAEKAGDVKNVEEGATGALQKVNAEQATEQLTEPQPEPQPITEVTKELAPEKAVPEIAPVVEEEQESLIVMDRSAIPGKGNELIVTNETELKIPLYITNPTDRNAIMSLQVPEGSWLEFDREKMTVKPETTETVTATITPNYEILKNYDYTAKINAKLEGKKISHEEELNFVVKKKASWLPWMLGAGIGLLLLLVLVVVLVLAGREKKPKDKKKEKKEKPKKAAAVKAEKKAKKKKPAKKKKTKPKKEEGSLWPLVLGVVIVGLIVGALGFWAYNTFKAPSGNSENGLDNNLQEGISKEPTEQLTQPEQEPSADIIEEPAVVGEENVTEQQEPEEPKLTEEDIQESLITLDRNNVPGEGSILKVKNQNYTLPLSIKNPTDKTARFVVNTGNESWLHFEEEKIIVEPETIKKTDMTLVPDWEKLKKNDYKITLDTTLAGEKIDYEESLEFVMTSNSGWPWWAWALIGLVGLGIVILISEIVRRKEKPVGGKKKSQKKAAKQKKGKKTKASKKSNASNDEIEKEIEKIKKRTLLKIDKK